MTDITINEFLKKKGLDNIEQLEQILSLESKRKTKSDYDHIFVTQLFSLYDLHDWKKINETYINLENHKDTLKKFNEYNLYDNLRKVLLISEFPKLSNSKNFKKDDDVLFLIKGILRKNNFDVYNYQHNKYASIVRITKQS